MQYGHDSSLVAAGQICVILHIVYSGPNAWVWSLSVIEKFDGYIICIHFVGSILFRQFTFSQIS